MNAWAAAAYLSNGEWLRGWRMKRSASGCFGRRARMRFAKTSAGRFAAIHAGLMRFPLLPWAHEVLALHDVREGLLRHVKTRLQNVRERVKLLR